MIKRFIYYLFAQCLLLFFCLYMISLNNQDYKIQKLNYNYNYNSELIIEKNSKQPYLYLKQYEYNEWDNTMMLINGELCPYNIKILPYYPEQFYYSSDDIYLSEQFKNIPNINELSINNRNYTNIHYIEQDPYIRELIVFIPYQNMTVSNYYCYFVDLESLNIDLLSEYKLKDNKSISKILQNKNAILDNKNSLIFFTLFIYSIEIILTLFLSYHVVMSIQNFDITLRLFGIAKIYLIITKLLLFSLIMISEIIVFNFLKTYAVNMVIINLFTYLCVYYILTGRKTIAELLRKTK